MLEPPYQSYSSAGHFGFHHHFSHTSHHTRFLQVQGPLRLTPIIVCTVIMVLYHIVGMFGEFGKSSVICPTLTSQILADKWYPYCQNLSIRQTLFRQLLLIQQFAKHQSCQTFQLYSIYLHLIGFNSDKF